MKIGVLGTGKVGATLAAGFAAAGHEVRVANSRGPQSVAEIFPPSAGPVTAADAAAVLQCGLVLLAIPWLRVPDVLTPALSWQDRILVDATNIFASYKQERVVADLKGDHGSEIVARLAPGARVVKAFNTLPFDVMFAPAPAGMRRVLLIAGDDADAVRTVAGLVSQLGLHPVAAGGLAAGGRLMEVGGPFSGLELFAAAGQASST